MIFTYDLGIYVGIVGLITTSVVAIWKAYPAGRTLAALLVSVYLTGLLTVEFLPFSFGPDPMFEQNLGAYPIPLTLVFELLGGPSGAGDADACASLAKMTLAFFPFGLLAPFAIPRLQKPRAFVTALTVMAFGVELIQLGEDALVGTFSKRISFDEALLAMVGGLMGYVVWYLVRWVFLRLTSMGSTPD